VRWPLWRPVLTFGAVSVMSALLAAHPGEGLVACKKLLLVAALHVSADELDSAEQAERLLSALALAVAGAAAVGLVQVSFCPARRPTTAPRAGSTTAAPVPAASSAAA